MITPEQKTEREEMTKLAKNERSKKYYEEKTKAHSITCDVCCCQLTPYYYNVHIKTARHLKWAELKNKKMNLQKKA